MQQDYGRCSEPLFTGALDELKVLLGDLATLVLEAIEVHIPCFFVQAI